MAGLPRTESHVKGDIEGCDQKNEMEDAENGLREECADSRHVAKLGWPTHRRKNQWQNRGQCQEEIGYSEIAKQNIALLRAQVGEQPIKVSNSISPTVCVNEWNRQVEKAPHQKTPEQWNENMKTEEFFFTDPDESSQDEWQEPE